MNLILDVAEKIETQFRRLWPFQHQQEFFRSREIAKEGEYFKTLSEARRHTDALKPDEETPVKAFLAAEVAKATEKTTSTEEQRRIFREVGQAISDEFGRLTPETVTRETPEVAKDLVELLTRFSKSYSKEGKQRAPDALLEYMLALDYDHVFWLWDLWIKACTAVGDYLSAEGLMAAATDGTTPASTHFAQRAKRYQPSLMVSKAMIALHRDGDVERAYEIANNARITFGASPDAVGCYKAIATLKRDSDEGRLLVASARVPTVALITGKWENEA